HLQFQCSPPVVCCIVISIRQECDHRLGFELTRVLQVSPSSLNAQIGVIITEKRGDIYLGSVAGAPQFKVRKLHPSMRPCCIPIVEESPRIERKHPLAVLHEAASHDHDHRCT